MVDFLEHIWQAHHNQQYATLTLTTHSAYRDWAITCAFYAALHFAEACFTTQADVRRPETVEPHAFRASTISNRAKTAFKSYMRLQTACWNVRYLARGTWQERYDVADAEKYVKDDLPRCRAELERAFGVNLNR